MCPMGSRKKARDCYSFHKIFTLFFLCSQGQFGNSESVEQCGVVDEALARQEPRAKVPWTAALYYQSTQCDFRPAGNGHAVIIGPTTVLLKGSFMWSTDHNGSTRMESYLPDHFMVVVGLKSKIPFVADQHTQFLKIASIHPHYLSHDQFSEYDYVIIHLKNSIQFTPFTRPICVDTLPDGIFERNSNSFLNDYLALTGFRIGSSSRNYRGVLHMDSEPFGLFSPEFCAAKLKRDLNRASAAPTLHKAGTPCGITTASMGDLIGIRSVIGSAGKTDFTTAQLQLFNETYLEAVKGVRPLQNVCFHNGAAVVTLYQGKWHLVGIVTESLGISCSSNLYFVSFVASRNNVNWISQHLRYGSNSFVCADGQTIPDKNRCNAEPDCMDSTDEDEKICGCVPLCSNYCLMRKFCRHCNASPTLKIIGQITQTYKFSTAVTPLKNLCPPVTPPVAINVYCKVPSSQANIPCRQQHFPGTQAIYSCQYPDTRTPSSCQTTCQENGQWTDELKSFHCKPLLTNTPSITDNRNGNGNAPPPGIQRPEDIFVTDRSNISTTLRTTSGVVTTSRMPVVSATENPISFPNKYKDKNGAPLCPPLKALKGTEVTCWTSTSKRFNCSDPMPPGTKAEFICARYYRPVLQIASVTKQCLADGDWSLSNRQFECKLDCGIPKSELLGHVVNGKETDGAKWPWHALIFTNSGNKPNLTYICGSTLISRKILVTAAHCVTDRRGNSRSESYFKVVLAATSNIYHKNILDPEIQIFDVTRIIVNPVYNSANFEADIAIIQLSRPAVVSDYVRPACYPSTYGAHTELKHLSPGSVGTVVGFGYDETGKPSQILREAGLPVVSYKDCYEVSKIQHTPTQYCAGFTNGTSVCNGDSGGGQFFEEELPRRRYYLQGIVSHGNKNSTSRFCDHNQYSVFTKVGAFKDWISTMGYELDDDF